MNLENIFIAIDKEIYIDELMLFLEQRKEKGYGKIKPVINEKVIEFICYEN